MFFDLVRKNSRRSRKENGLFFVSLLIVIVAFYMILSLSRLDVMIFLKKMESDAVNKLLLMIPVFYGITLFILFFWYTLPADINWSAGSMSLGFV